MRRLSAICVSLATLTLGVGCNVPQETVEEFQTLQRGEATIACRDGLEVSRYAVTDITTIGVHNALQDCNLFELTLFYEGEIDRSFAQFIKIISDRNWPYERRVMFIHSAGGDVEAALRIGRDISKEPWSVFVARSGEAPRPSTAQCYSACIFILAAARERAILGTVAIHRIYPSGSEALSRSELAAELADIEAQAKEFMRENGVSTSIVDDMMSIPSSDIRLLSPNELDEYGLAGENSAQLDLERLDLERRCGTEFVGRLASARHQVEIQCEPRLRAACAVAGGTCTVAANNDMDQCVNDANRQFGFPDASCPNDGPYFHCADGRISRNCETN